MFITREMDYAVRIVRSLNKGLKLSAEEISKEEYVPISFAYKVLKKLSKADIVKIIRGTYGGYILNPNKNANIYDVITAVDKDFLITECLRGGYNCPNNSDDFCLVHKEFLEIQNMIEERLKNIDVNSI